MVNTGAALRRLWTDRLTVTEYKKVARPDKSTGFEEDVAIDGIPCKLSFKSLYASGQGPGAAAVDLGAKLFLGKAINIMPGSKLTVTRPGGYIFMYSQSGLPGVFSSHQEIMLAPLEGWA
jgi:hypothetical protein